MYKEVRASVEEQMAEGVWFGVTTDLWNRHGGGGEPFMSFTVHCISTDWKLKTHCLETLFPRRPHSRAYHRNDRKHAPGLEDKEREYVWNYNRQCQQYEESLCIFSLCLVSLFWS
ncbi:hypothetical protein QQF64_003158 [Cirrhinus molitorella]|uniref:Uncharacterized protein n=1 Tax=Cirrhinus molitorella TaxID=172907 RepID=A0ABR3MJ75_9TELE